MCEVTPRLESRTSQMRRATRGSVKSCMLGEMAERSRTSIKWRAWASASAISLAPNSTISQPAPSGSMARASRLTPLRRGGGVGGGGAAAGGGWRRGAVIDVGVGGGGGFFFFLGGGWGGGKEKDVGPS